jgi:translation initiation factor 1A
LLVFSADKVVLFTLGRTVLGKRKVLSESEIKPRLPEDFEVLGIAEKLLGYDRIMVRCLDGFTRLCRIRGKMKRRVWIKVNDIVTVSPWDFQTDKRGDITYRYKGNQTEWLRNNGYLKDIHI